MRARGSLRLQQKRLSNARSNYSIRSQLVLHHARMVLTSVSRGFSPPLLHYGHDGAIFDGPTYTDDAIV